MRTLKKSVATVAALLFVLLGWAHPVKAPTEAELRPSQPAFVSAAFEQLDRIVKLDEDRQLQGAYREARKARVLQEVRTYAGLQGISYENALQVLGNLAPQFVLDRHMVEVRDGDSPTARVNAKLSVHNTLIFVQEDYWFARRALEVRG